MPLDCRFIERCVEVSQSLRWAYENEAPPFSLNQLLKHFGVADVRSRLLDRDARLVRSDGRVLIEVNSLFPVVRRRLSIAHELAHIIVNEVAGRDRYSVRQSDPREESLCNLLAGQLLSPDWAVRDYLEDARALGGWQDAVRCGTILRAASYFGVSVDVMARRMLQDLDLAPSKIAIVWRYRDSALRISSSWHARHDRRFIPRNKTAPITSVLVKVYENGGVHRANEELTLGSLKGKFLIEAAGFRSSAPAGIVTRAVLTLLTPS
jgi:Zn-dependent peptidase ImmA (M78 family)